MTTAAAVRAALRAVADPEKAAFYPRFFRAGPGEYGEGDRFMGVTVPKQRRIAKRCRTLPLRSVRALLRDPFHECRLTGLFVMVDRFGRTAGAERKAVVDLYLDHLDCVNNWDLVDASAHKILGAWLADGDRGLLYDLAASGHLWRQRIAIIATHDYIQAGDFDDTLALADRLMDHPHDLIHKAVGWMIREVGKQDQGVMEDFLASRYRAMPRTMLRYAIEKLPEERRRAYLEGRVSSNGPL
ncbi:MAG: DNA alkylation repair protein [Gemmatimonadetes bacterium]|nr:DNA alkylation repair protein [Gemmatimonadota bacterium]